MSDWMSKLDDKLSIAELNIPGTHDSAAYKQGGDSVVLPGLGGWWKCQDKDFDDQLRAGIRYFDLRFRYYPTQERGYEVFHFHHGSVYLGGIQTALKTFQQFLKNHPTEFLILQIQQEHSKQKILKFGQKLRDEFSGYGCQDKSVVLPLFNSSKKNYIPTVGQMRGKIFLIQAAKVWMGQFQIDTDEPVRKKISEDHYVLQNAWNDPDNTFNYDKTKQLAIRSLMGEPKRSDRMKINYISWEPGTRGCHNDYLNSIIDEYEHVGITIMDFPPQSLINKIINKNSFKY